MHIFIIVLIKNEFPLRKKKSDFCYYLIEKNQFHNALRKYFCNNIAFYFNLAEIRYLINKRKGDYYASIT